MVSPAWAVTQQRDPARLPQFQRADPVLVDKGLFDRRLGRTMQRDHRGQLIMQRQQPHRQIITRRMGDAVGNMGDPRSGHINQPPAHVPQARIYPQYTHCLPLVLCYPKASTKGEQRPSAFATALRGIHPMGGVWRDESDRPRPND